MKTKHYITVIIGLLTILFLSVVGNVITIGDKLSSVNVVLGWLFYAFIGVFVMWFILIPMLKVLFTPQLDGEPIEMISNLNPDELSEYIKRVKLTAEQKKRITISDNRKNSLLEILKEKQGEKEAAVKQSATMAFVFTAISQNRSIDLLMSIGICFRMINSLIKLSGVRPSYLQMTKLYISVFSASFVITSIEDIMEDMDFGEAFGVLGCVVSNTLTRSAANGMMNAFVCLRVGYATIKYLEVGGKFFDKEKNKMRKDIRRAARASIVGVSKDGFAEVKKRISTLFD